MKLEVARPGTTRIGWIGTGVMGASMCGHLIRAGFPATVFNRTRAKAEPLLEQGAGWADTPRAVAEQSEVVFTIVGFPCDVREVILGDQGVLSGCRPGSIVVDMTTSEPSLAGEIAEAAGRLSTSPASTRRFRAETWGLARRGSPSWSAVRRKRFKR